MRRQLCNRCGDHYRPRDGGEFELSGGATSVQAYVCADCYGQLLAAFKEVPE